MLTTYNASEFTWYPAKYTRFIFNIFLPDVCIEKAVNPADSVLMADEMLPFFRPGDIVATHFLVKRILGSGSFGQVLEAVDARTNARVAIKIEPSNARDPQLLYEHKIMRALDGCEGFPRSMIFMYDDAYNYLVMERLNVSVEQLADTRGGILPVQFLKIVGAQMLTRLQTFHMHGFVHRDIKPANIMIYKDLVYLIDFGLSKRVLDPSTGQHIPFRDNKPLVGTPRYLSANAHEGKEQSRRDDIESLMYVLIFLAKGKLPWQGHASEEVGHIKRSIDVSELCAGLPKRFAFTLRYARAMQYDEDPQYSMLIDMWSTE